MQGSRIKIFGIWQIYVIIGKTEGLHRSFRIFFVVTLDDEPDAKRSQLYRLCLLHFAIRKRCEYGIHGWSKPIDVDDVELQLALSLFHELSSMEKEISFHCLRTSVLDIVYLSKIDNSFDARVFAVMCEWFFIGVNKFDDSLIEPLFPKTFRWEDVIHHLRSLNPEAYVLTGMHRNVDEYYRRKQLQKLAADVRTMFGNRDETLEMFCGGDSSKGELKDDTEVVGNLIVQCIQRELDAHQPAHLHRKRWYGTVISRDLRQRFRCMRKRPSVGLQKLLPQRKRVICAKKVVEHVALVEAFMQGTRGTIMRRKTAMLHIACGAARHLTQQFVAYDYLCTKVLRLEWISKPSGWTRAEQKVCVGDKSFQLQIQRVPSRHHERKVLVEVADYVLILEFQKRGLPHVHVLLCTKREHQLLLPEDIDHSLRLTFLGSHGYAKMEFMTNCQNVATVDVVDPPVPEIDGVQDNSKLWDNVEAMSNALRRNDDLDEPQANTRGGDAGANAVGVQVHWDPRAHIICQKKDNALAAIPFGAFAEAARCRGKYKSDTAIALATTGIAATLLIVALRLEYATKQGMTFDEVMSIAYVYTKVTCTGRLSDPPEGQQEYMQFLGCVLLGCKYDEKSDQIAELTSGDVHQRLQRVWVRAERRTKVPDERITITLHDRDTIEAILPVYVNSIIPASHWILRGVRILTFMPT
uniref:Helitron helicase-like domain-containing protein n=2 Tax=Parascaris univalens TaxID=6257 RepID=A0A915BMN5_PARUN